MIFSNSGTYFQTLIGIYSAAFLFPYSIPRERNRRFTAIAARMP